jgi:hypothetical protein
VPLAWLLVASLPVAAFLCGACRSKRFTSDAGVGGSKNAEAGVRTFWVRNSPLLDASAKPLGTIKGPLLVEVSPKGRAKSLPGTAQSVDGYLPASLLTAPIDGEGLALYAQRQADLHDQSAKGPVIGRVYPGAFVSVAPSSPGYLNIALPAFRADFVGSQKQVVAVVDAAAFDSAPVPLQGPSPEGQLLRDFSINAPLWAAEVMPELSQPFVATLCGDIRVLSVGAQRSRVSQYHAGVEVVGWYGFPIDVAQYCPLYRCKQRVVFQDGPALSLTGTGTTQADKIQISSPPDGFVHAELTSSDALAGRIKGRLPVYWLTQSKAHTARCSKWTFDGVTTRKGDSSVSVVEGRMRGDPLVLEGERTLPSFAVTYEPADPGHGGTLTLKGLHFNKLGSPPGTVGDPNSYRAITAYSFVGTTKDALRMFNGEWSVNKGLVAWHPDDEEHWFFSAEACAAAASAASSALSAGSETPPGGFHVDCFTELNK